MSSSRIRRIVTGHDTAGRLTGCSEGALPSVVKMAAISDLVSHVLDDSEVRPSPGRVVIKRGTYHAWSNRSDQG